ncbi:MAG: nitrilase-related carbon-nitrogen hydrolase [Gemmatimonadota bacterium]
MRVAGLQMDLAWEDPRENFRRAEAMARAAMDPGQVDQGVGGDASESMGAEERAHPPDLLVLPEMFATGFSMEARRMAEFAEETRTFLRGLARELSVHVLAGYAEPTGGRPANACSVFDAGGEEILHFRKLHPFSLAREDEYYQPGEALVTGRVAGASVTPLICYDLRFPEPFRAAARDTDLFCVLANWPAKRSHAWSTLLKARAIENQAFVLGVNRVGMGGGEFHSGDSAFLDPLGLEAGAMRPFSMAREGPPGAGILHGQVDPLEVREVRERFGFLADARPDLYLRLSEARGET